MKPQVQLYCDGSGTTSDKPCGFAAVLLCNGVRKEVHGSLSNGTNNVAELMAAILGLETLKRPCVVTVTSDSQYVVNGIKEGWAKKWKKKGYIRAMNNEHGSLVPEYVTNWELWDRLLNACEIHEATFVWVRGHDGNIENERCDHLANEARKSHVLVNEKSFELR